MTDKERRIAQLTKENESLKEVVTQMTQEVIYLREQVEAFFSDAQDCPSDEEMDAYVEAAEERLVSVQGESDEDHHCQLEVDLSECPMLREHLVQLHQRIAELEHGISDIAMENMELRKGLSVS